MGARPGTYALSLLEVPLNIEILRALEAGPRSLTDLRRTAGSPPPTTMREHLRTLTELGAVERRRQSGFPGAVDFVLTAAGQGLLDVAVVLQGWLAVAPEGELELGTAAAGSAIKALVDGWSTGIIRVLAARPLSLTELDRVIQSVNYPSLERRLSAMRLAGQIERLPAHKRGTPYGITPWLRQAVAPLGAAAHWERQNGPPGAGQISRVEVEAAFLLGIPLVRLPQQLQGTCRLAVEVKSGRDGEFAGVLAAVEHGRIASCITRIEGLAESWVSGSASSWLRTVLEGRTDGLEVGGDCQLAHALLDGFRSALLSPLVEPG